MPYFVFDSANNKYEGMTKEEILAAIVQAISTHEISDVDTGFVTTLKEGNNGNALKMWVGTTAQYNAIQTKENNCLYILSDDTELEDLETAINSMATDISNNRDDIDELSNDLDTATGRITDAETAISAAQDDIDEINDKNGAVLFSGTWTPDAQGGTLSGDYSIADYNAIKITIEGVEIMCSVEHDTTNHVATARGSFIYNRLNQQEQPEMAYIDVYSVCAEFNETTNAMTTNKSEYIEVFIPTNVALITRTAQFVNITKIVGVC